MKIVVDHPDRLARAVQTACDAGYVFPVLHTAVDYQTEIELVYVLRNPDQPAGDDYWIWVRIDGQDPQIDSMTPQVPGLEFQEREVYDLFGVRYRGHPDLRRLLLPERFVGHPLRKAYTQIDGDVAWEGEEDRP